MARPYQVWSISVISLVSFGVNLFTATETKSEIRFHQLSRKTGERIRHQKVSADNGDTAVDKARHRQGLSSIARAGEYITIEPEEIKILLHRIAADD